MKNLYIVNKTYFHHSQTLDPEIFYNDYESIVLNVPIYLHGLMVQNDDAENVESDEEEFDVDDLGEVQFEGVHNLINQDTLELYSMAAEKIGGWDESENIILWDETTVGQKAKDFHESQQ